MTWSGREKSGKHFQMVKLPRATAIRNPAAKDCTGGLLKAQADITPQDPQQAPYCTLWAAPLPREPLPPPSPTPSPRLYRTGLTEHRANTVVRSAIHRRSPGRRLIARKTVIHYPGSPGSQGRCLPTRKHMSHFCRQHVHYIHTTKQWCTVDG